MTLLYLLPPKPLPTDYVWGNPHVTNETQQSIEHAGLAVDTGVLG